MIMPMWWQQATSLDTCYVHDADELTDAVEVRGGDGDVGGLLAANK